jgi:hypothetical protein
MQTLRLIEPGRRVSTSMCLLTAPMGTIIGALQRDVLSRGVEQLIKQGTYDCSISVPVINGQVSVEHHDG